MLSLRVCTPGCSPFLPDQQVWPASYWGAESFSVNHKVSLHPQTRCILEPHGELENIPMPMSTTEAVTGIFWAPLVTQKQKPRLPTPSQKPCTCQSLCGPNNFLSLLGRCLVSFRCYYHYNYQYETTSSLSIPNTTICVISTNHSQITSIPPSPDCWNYHATNRSLSKHHFFQPCRKRRPYPISTPALVLWPPRGLQSHSTKLWNNFTHCYLLIR